MILFQSDKEKLESTLEVTPNHFKEIKSVESPSADKLRAYWDKLFGRKDTYKPDESENYFAEVFGRTSDEFRFDFEIGRGLRDGLDRFSSEKWTSLSEGEQIATIKEFSTSLADKLGLQNPPVVEFFNGPNDSCGAYNFASNTITINRALFYDPAEVVDTIAHETWHAYQHQRANMMETKQDYLYKLNFDNYLSPVTLGDGKYLFFTDYQEQLVEAEARAFANIFREEVAV